MSETTDKRGSLIVFPATTGYLDEAAVLLKSLSKHMPAVPVHIMSRNGEADHLKEFKNVEEIINEPLCDSEFRQIRTSRFRHAADMKDRFKVVCLLDADMVVLRSLEAVFRMAETGTILVGSNNTIFRYTKKDFVKMQVDAPDDIDAVHGSFCTVPLFINPTIHCDFLMKVWGNTTGNDLDVPNLLAVSMGLSSRLYYLPSYLFLNIHHSMLKPETGCTLTSQGLFSRQGEPVYIIHGHWGDADYVAQLIDPMIKNYGYYPKYIESARDSIRILKAEYEKYR